MPNYSHGTAGCAAALAIAGEALARPGLVEAAMAGARHLVSVADMSGEGFQIAHYLPERDTGEEPVTYSWCHGPAGSSLLFAALDHAGVDDISGFAPVDLRRRALRSVLDSGIPQRLRPGFWDNDGRCCGTAGVGDVLLDAAQDESDPTLAREYLAAATLMADALLERAITDATGMRWRFIEHRRVDSLLPPGTGWMQGAAGIAAYLMRMSRVLDEGLDRAGIVDRPDQWWAVPARLRTVRPT
jgi:lantibiotic modifying enzyme